MLLFRYTVLTSLMVTLISESPQFFAARLHSADIVDLLFLPLYRHLVFSCVVCELSFIRFVNTTLILFSIITPSLLLSIRSQSADITLASFLPFKSHRFPFNVSHASLIWSSSFCFHTALATSDLTLNGISLIADAWFMSSHARIFISHLLHLAELP